MKLYVWVSFAFMGWAYYEMSGGAEFSPTHVAKAEQAESEIMPEIVTRADTTTLLSVSTSNVTSQPDEAQIVATAFTAEPQEPVEAPALETTVEPAPLDLRYVANPRVNMRQGPGTNHSIIVTLTRGTEVEVLEVNATGWAHLRATETGEEGWMAERLLSDS